MHILSPETDNCPSWISGRERMTVENILWSNLQERMLPNPQRSSWIRFWWRCRKCLPIKPHFYRAGLIFQVVNQYCAHSFTRNWQLPFLNQLKGENDCKNISWSNLQERMLPTLQGSSCIQFWWRCRKCEKLLLDIRMRDGLWSSDHDISWPGAKLQVN